MANEFKTPDERPDDIILRDKEANEALYDEYGAHFKNRKDTAHEEEEKSDKNNNTKKEYKPEILTITEVEEKVNIEIDKYINDPDLMRDLCKSGKGLNTKDFQLELIRKLIEDISENKKVMKLNDESLIRTYKNINFPELWKAIFNYKNKHRVGKYNINDKSEELDEANSQLERYRKLTKKEIFEKLKFFREGLSTHDEE